MQNSVATLDEDWIDGIDEMIYRSDRLVLVPERRPPSPLLHFGKRQASSSANFSSHRPTSLSRFFREKEGGETQAGRNVSTGEEANDSWFDYRLTESNSWIIIWQGPPSMGHELIFFPLFRRNKKKKYSCDYARKLESRFSPSLSDFSQTWIFSTDRSSARRRESEIRSVSRLIFLHGGTPDERGGWRGGEAEGSRRREFFE